jgi:adenosine kinase
MNIVLTGSIAYDYIMKFPGHFKDHILPDQLECLSLSFLVESLVRHRGGIAPNIAYTLALLGGRPRLFATAGEDFEEYRLWLERRGVDTTGVRVIPGEFTASFFANTDQDNAQIASFYPGAMAFARDLSLHDLPGDRPDLVLISPNDPQAMQRYVGECQDLDIPYIYDPSQQIVRLNEEALRRGVEGALALFVNQYEFRLIQTHARLTSPEILARTRFAVVTNGARGADISTQEGAYHVPAIEPEGMVDPTGVGDAFRGGFLAGFAHGWSPLVCGQMGSVAASFCLERRGTQAHDFTPAEFVARYRRYFDDQGLLEALIPVGEAKPGG